MRPHLAVSLYAGARRANLELSWALWNVPVMMFFIINPEDHIPPFQNCCHCIGYDCATCEWKSLKVQCGIVLCRFCLCLAGKLAQLTASLPFDLPRMATWTMVFIGLISASTDGRIVSAQGV